MIHVFAFYLFATLVVCSGALTILSRNPVHSVLWLILAFFNAAGLMVLLGAEFIAMLLIIVYVGAVAVLFLFVVMMLDIDFAELRAGFVDYLPFGMLIALVLLAEIVLGIGIWSAGPIELAQRAAPANPELSNIQAIGGLLYTRYIFLFEAAGIILLVAMIGAIVLTLRHKPNVKRQVIAEQNARTVAASIEVRKVEPGRGI